MKRSGIARPTGEKLESALQRQREQRAASVKRQQEKQRRAKQSPGAGRLRQVPIPRENRERKAKRREVEFGVQAEWSRHHPCAACRPELYGDDLLALEHHSPVRISDPHHTKSRPGGLDHDTIPLCGGPAGCHAKCSAPGWSERRLQEGCGLDFRRVAVIIAREIGGNQ